ncbi:MAG TPA: lipoprotein [Gammaproteobacteria bacterium]|nr:lipoprotein [Gammaproteobacteria bacterium]
MLNRFRILPLIFIVALTASCGQSGPLYLPPHTKAQTNHVE